VNAVARLLVTSLVVVGSACGDGGSGPSSGGEGVVNLVLETPYTDDGGLLIAVTGAGVKSVTSDSYELTYSPPGDAGVTLLLRGNIAAGVVAEITVPHRDRLGKYQVTVLQAASRGPLYQQRGLAGYRVRLVAP
jgi:hypothetical protein